MSLAFAKKLLKNCSFGIKVFGEYFLNKPGNLFSNFDILLGTSQRTIYMKFKKIH
jgi:hypothetical protein